MVLDGKIVFFLNFQKILLKNWTKYKFNAIIYIHGKYPLRTFAKNTANIHNFLVKMKK
jgi:hypothetical protein